MYPVDKESKRFKRGFKEEKREHPTFNDRQVETIVTDHLSKHKYMYRK